MTPDEMWTEPHEAGGRGGAGTHPLAAFPQHQCGWVCGGLFPGLEASKLAGRGWRVGWEDFLSSAPSFLRTILGGVEGALRVWRGIIYTRPRGVWS